jgi:hypothetical protein
MSVSYPTKYQDKFGEETTTIHNDGKTLRMNLRGVEFVGRFLDDWEPSNQIDIENATRFPLHHNELYSYSMKFEIPVPVTVKTQTISGTLRANLELGKPNAKGGVDYEKLQLQLAFNDKTYVSSENQGWFDDALNEIQTQLPEKSFIKCCHSCAYSDYSPAGYGLFGGLACFRNCKQEYLALKGKMAYFTLVDKIAEFVQETHLCPEFQKRTPGTGYRG